MIGDWSFNDLSEKALIKVFRIRWCVSPAAVKRDSAPFMGGVWLNGSFGISGFVMYISFHAPEDVVEISSGAIRTMDPYCA